MKKAVLMILIIALLFSFAACSGKSTGKAGDTSVSAVPDIEISSESSLETSTEQNDEEVIKKQILKLTGEWNYAGEDVETLMFSDEGKGSYSNLNGEIYTFSYEVRVEHKEYNNGEPYINTVMKVNYDSGDSEEMIFFFNEEGESTVLAFHNLDDGGYNGFMTFPEWTKK